MDTQSEQAPHTGSRVGNDKCNISHLKKKKEEKNPSHSSAHDEMDHCVKKKKAKDQTFKKNQVCEVICGPCEAALEGLFASCSTEVG